MKHYGLSLVGGDISSVSKGMSLSATLIGYAEKCLKRSGAKKGDRIYVTGNLGDSACGLELLKRISDKSRKMVKNYLGNGEGVKGGDGEMGKRKKSSLRLRLPDSPGLLF